MGDRIKAPAGSEKGTALFPRRSESSHAIPIPAIGDSYLARTFTGASPETKQPRQRVKMAHPHYVIKVLATGMEGQMPIAFAKERSRSV